MELTQNERAVNNFLIAQFMGYTYPDIECEAWKLNTDLHRYDKDWNLLMSVVEKIESLPINNYKSLTHLDDIDGDIDGHFWFRRIGADTEIFMNIYYWQPDVQLDGLTKKYTGKSPIESLYNAVIQFIKFYNLNIAKKEGE